MTLDLDGWDEDSRTPVDNLLYATARELLNNVAKHAHAASAQINLMRDDGCVQLEVIDDGRGIPDDAMRRSVRHGHIGLASHQVRVQAAGGELTVSKVAPSGTVARVELPLGMLGANGSGLDRARGNGSD